ncbi:MAG: hypothetical protein VCC00_06275 [Deltaproteobacteria bacterium]
MDFLIDTTSLIRLWRDGAGSRESHFITRYPTLWVQDLEILDYTSGEE